MRYLIVRDDNLPRQVLYDNETQLLEGERAVLEEMAGDELVGQLFRFVSVRFEVAEVLLDTESGELSVDWRAV